ncbi:MAG TPA: zf-TFIIB domain-containing protein [Fimbriimonadaceae bacterium]|nr:zf-TFIIB domain-containing protein [Fimbriimonadaceae bacterium]
MNGAPCVNCAQPMTALNFRDVPISVCPRCHGLWFPGESVRIVRTMDTDRLSQLEALNKPVAHVPAPSAGRFCPDDMNELRKHPYAFDRQVVVEGCDTCEGIWFDAGELDTLEEALALKETAGPPPAAKQTAAIAEVEHLGEMEHLSKVNAALEAIRHRILWPGL